jgi:murein DD-endopeptidase MepM/ murein hydrolase activator NlpD
VPNFFIDSFRIPPFLLPIYQAAGIEYDVPWQVLAAINEIETDYGRDLAVSSAGAVGWMQFLPSTWKQWGMDANGDGVADPYNPVDAIFSAARYLHAAGASKNLSNAILAYNHADWYVQSVLLRAKLIGGIPNQLIDALTGLVQGHFPVAAAAKYDDDSVVGLAKRKVHGTNAAVPVDSDPNSKGTTIFAKQGSPVIAVNDGKIVKIGQSATLGRYIELQDSTGNIYSYAQLGSITTTYPVPKPVKITPAAIAKELAAPADPAPSSPATAGAQQAAKATAPPAVVPTSDKTTVRPRTAATGDAGHLGDTPAWAGTSSAASAPVTPRVKSDTAAPKQTVATPLVKERLFANPTRPASYAAGGVLQVKTAPQQITSFRNYFSDVLHLARNQYTLQPLKTGAIVVAGTILGRIAAPTPSLASHLYFTIQPAGKNAPQIDPKPILDGWKLLEATAVYRADGVDPFFGPGAKNPTVGQVLLMSKLQLTNRILQDPHVQIYACGRRDIASGQIDRRVLATIEFLSASGLDPYVSGLDCGHSLTGSTGTDAAGATGASLDISKINNIPILGHQGPGSITDITTRRLLTLQGAMTPDQVISTMSYSGQSNTIALPDHNNRIQVTFTPQFGTNKKLSAEIKSILQAGQWAQLINRISQIPEPVVPIAPSKYALRTRG